MDCDVKHPIAEARHASLALPVLGTHSLAGSNTPQRPRSRMGPRRAVVLGLIQLLMIAHVVQWWIWGRTMSPLEPSESMSTLKDGLVNAGAILFALALLSTLLLGRFFCGWGCHILLLQDLCAWMLGKLGIRPKPFRSRLLLWVPLLLALYMFAWPLVYRFAVAPYTRPDLSWPGFRSALVVTDFWATFPGLLVGVPFLLVCGFLTVYFLGMKGYCTYGCPYGGFFAPLDEFAVGRIRVTDACEQCGHCTAVCTSNVRVHEEVRDFRMVVDPGCMKCLDCISACPKDALYFGFGAPAASRVPRVARPARHAPDLAWGEEIGVAVAAALAFLATRGTYGVSLPLLFASGVAACATYVLWKGWRTLRGENEHVHRLQLRLKGRLRPAGAAWIAASALLAAVTLWSAAVNALSSIAAWQDDRVRVPPEMVFSGNPVQLEPSAARGAERALRLYGTVSAWNEGGYGLLPAVQPSIDMRRLWLLSALGRFGEAEALVRRRGERDGWNEAYAATLARVLRGAHRDPEAERWYAENVAAHPEWREFGDEYAAWLEREGRTRDAIDVARRALARRPDELIYMRRLSLLLMQHGGPAETEEGIALTRRTLEIAPDNPFAYRALAAGLARLERFDEAEAALREAVRLAPGDHAIRQALGEFLIGIGKSEEGALLLRDARRDAVSRGDDGHHSGHRH